VIEAYRPKRGRGHGDIDLVIEEHLVHAVAIGCGHPGVISGGPRTVRSELITTPARLPGQQ